MMLFFSMLESKLKNELKTCGIIFLKFKNYNQEIKKYKICNKRKSIQQIKKLNK